MLEINNFCYFWDRPFNKVIAVDFKNAYGMIKRPHILEQMSNLGVEPTLVNYIKHLLDKQQMIFTDVNGEHRTINPSRGIAQGDSTSSLLFCIGVNDLLEKSNNTNIRTVAYADDFAIMGKKRVELKKNVEHI